MIDFVCKSEILSSIIDLRCFSNMDRYVNCSGYKKRLYFILFSLFAHNKNQIWNIYKKSEIYSKNISFHRWLFSPF